MKRISKWVTHMEIRNYRITAKYRIQKREILFRKDIRAIDKQRAVEKFYDYPGSQNLRRSQIKIIEIKEISPEEIKNRKLRKIAISENPALYVE